MGDLEIFKGIVVVLFIYGIYYDEFNWIQVDVFILECFVLE